MFTLTEMVNRINLKLFEETSFVGWVKQSAPNKINVLMDSLRLIHPTWLFSRADRPYVAGFGLMGGVHDAVIAQVYDPRISCAALEGVACPVAARLHAAKEAVVARWKGRIVVARISQA